jgi:hypothetical protein
MEPHTLDLAHDLRAPNLEGVYGPLLWVDVTTGRVWQEGSAGQGTPELGSGVHVLLVWVGAMVAVVSMGVDESQISGVSQAVRAFLGNPEAAVVFEQSWLPEKIGTRIAAQAPTAFSRRELARAEAYALVQARWLDLERVTVELATERFVFEASSVLDSSGRVRQIIAPSA